MKMESTSTAETLIASTSGAVSEIGGHFFYHALTSVLALLVVVGVSGNVLAIVTYLSSRKLRVPANMFIVSLAGADVMTLLCAPVIIVNVEAASRKGASGFSTTDDDVVLRNSPATCQLLVIVHRTSTSLDMLTMAAIAAVRYISIASSRSRVTSIALLSWSRCTVVLLLIWLYAVTWSLMVFIPDVATFEYSERLFICTDTSNVVFLAVNASLVYFPCAVVIVVCYVGIYVAVRQTRFRAFNKIAVFTEPQGRVANASENRRMLEESRLAIQLMFIVGVFVACWTPYLITNVIGMTEKVPVWLSNLFVVSIVFNAAINPVVYFVYNRVYRQEMRRIVFSWWPPSFCRRKQVSSSLSVALPRHHRVDVIIPLPCSSRRDSVTVAVVTGHRQPTANGVMLNIVETVSATIEMVASSMTNGGVGPSEIGLQ
jgi:uncharacterized membrane protein